MYNYKLNFELNYEQERCSKEIVSHYYENYNILLDAICGAGKTEILLEVIKIALNQNKIIGFACPRKQLIIELYQRVSKYFNYEYAGLVVGGVSIYQKSNLIFLTTHQLYKYKNYFDLLIIDEIDAFPFCDNYELENNALQAARQFIYLSATVPQKYYNLVQKKQLKLIKNSKRHHLKPVPQAKLVKVNQGNIFIKLSLILRKLKNKPIIIFVPTIKIGRKLSFYCRVMGLKNRFVYGANLENKDLDDFRNKEYSLLIATTVLERGITLKNLQVIIYLACHRIFDSTTLLQICGRVGRDTEVYYGEIFFLYREFSIEINRCIKLLREYESGD